MVQAPKQPPPRPSGGPRPHSMKNIFDVTKLDVVNVARAFGLTAPPTVNFALCALRRPLPTRQCNGRRGKLFFCRRDPSVPGCPPPLTLAKNECFFMQFV